MKIEKFIIAAVIGCMAVSSYYQPAATSNNTGYVTASVLGRARRAATAYPTAVSRSLTKARGQVDKNNLRQIGIALNAYELANNTLPRPDGAAGLKKLADQQNLPWSIFSYTGKRPQIFDEKSIAYLYLGETAAAIGGKNLPVAIAKRAANGGVCSVLFVDGTIRDYTISGKYTSAVQVVSKAVPQKYRKRYITAIKKIEKK